MRTALAVASTFALLVGSCFFAYRQYARNHLIGLLPQELEVSKTIAIEERMTGLTEGCAMAVFSIDPALLVRIKRNGVQPLGTSPKPRRAVEYPFSYSKWQETPADIALGGLRCAPIKRALENSIITALGVSGSYYTTSRKSELIVIPSQGLIVLSIFE